MPSFTDLGVSASVCSALTERGIHQPFPIQELVIGDALSGRDVLAKSRTGSGKTLAFAIPIVETLEAGDSRPSALVLVPTRELAVQVTEEFVADRGAPRGLRVASVYGGVSVREQADRAKKAHILVATPGRLQDVADRRMISLKGIKVLVLDEADRMLDMGFQPQVDRIVDMLPAQRQTMFFSATLDGQVGHLARAYTNNAAMHSIESPKETVEEADHRFIQVNAHDRVEKLIELLKEEGLSLVFVRTKRGADRLAYKLKAKGVNAAAMHGDLTQAARQKALDRFEDGKTKVLIATDVAARGLDLDDITQVINFDPPEDDKGYVHRVGRTARAGRSGTGITFVLPDQQADVSRMASRLALGDEFVEGGMEVAAPRIVFASHKGRKSSMRPRAKRRF